MTHHEPPDPVASSALDRCVGLRTSKSRPRIDFAIGLKPRRIAWCETANEPLVDVGYRARCRLIMSSYAFKFLGRCRPGYDATQEEQPSPRASYAMLGCLS